MSMISAMVLGADCVEDCDLLRSGQTAAVLGHRVAEPSTLGRSCARYVRARPPARPRGGRVAAPCVGRWRRPGRSATGPSTSTASSPWLCRAGHRVRLHQPARLSPDPGHQGGHRRGAACPPQDGVGEHLARDRSLLRRADRPRRARRCQRPQVAAREPGVLEQADLHQARPGGLAILDRRAPATARARRDRADEIIISSLPKRFRVGYGATCRPRSSSSGCR